MPSLIDVREIHLIKKNSFSFSLWNIYLSRKEVNMNILIKFCNIDSINWTQNVFELH